MLMQDVLHRLNPPQGSIQSSLLSISWTPPPVEVHHDGLVLIQQQTPHIKRKQNKKKRFLLHFKNAPATAPKRLRVVSE